MLEELDAEPGGDDRDALVLATIYHDAVYDPRRDDNEERSAALLLAHAANPGATAVTKSAELIHASKWDHAPQGALARRFFDLDSWQLTDGCPLHERMVYERGVYREYQWASWSTYREKRWEFLQGWADKFPEHRRGVAECIELLRAFQPRLAVYPGSFNPFHHGHLSILRQAEAVFDQVVVAIGVNRQKQGSLDSTAARCADLATRLRFHEVTSFDGLLTRFIDELELPAAIVRGVRDGTDLEAELRFVRFLNELRPDTGVVWISCEAELQHLSSSAIRELESIEPGAGQRYIPTTAEIYGLASP
jgi:pantetheine-phosphate adenylyltransferase